MDIKMLESVQNNLLDDIRSEFRRKIIGTIVGAVIAGAITAAAGIWAYAKTLSGSVGLVQKNSIVAFDGECPANGWEIYWAGTSRFIVGAADEPEMPKIPSNYSQTEGGTKLKSKAFLSHGGAEQRTILPQQMPRHSHDYINATTAAHINAGTKKSNIKFGDDAGLAVQSQSTTQEGESLPLDILPPYIALRLCKKL